MWNYPRLTITKIENAFLVQVDIPEKETKTYSFLTIDNVIEEAMKAFSQDGKE